MTEKTTTKEIIFWCIFIGSAIFCGVWIFRFAQDSVTEKGELIFTKNLSFEGSLNNLEIKVPEHESIIVKVQRKSISSTKSRYIGEFNQTIEGEKFPIRGTVALVDEIKFEKDKYVVMPMAVNFGGSGEFIYLILMKKTDSGLEHLSSVYVKDRIDYISLEEKNKKIIFNYNSHHISQAMVEKPIVPTISEFVIKDEKLIEGLTYFNTNDKKIIILKPLPNTVVSNNFEISFNAIGWLFENTSEASLVSEDYQKLDSQIASSTSDWMTSNLVPIKVNLNAGNYKGRAKVILTADNPSGIAKNDKRVEFWVYIK